MAGSLLRGLKRAILWDYPRASWQYDVIVALILVFLFFTPRDWFNDQPRIARASDIAMLEAERGSNVFFLEPQLLDGVSESDRLRKVAELLKVRTGKTQKVVKIDPIYDGEGALKGYMAFAKP